MKQLIAFIKKEYLELYRGGKLFLLLVLGVIFGIMSPAMAKLTPVIIKALGSELAEQGMYVGDITVNALTSWGQFYKNLDIAIIVPAIFFSGIMASEYQRGTLINLLTKGLERWKVVLAKLAFMVSVWTVYYFMIFFITNIYTDFYWDNSIVHNIIPAAMGIYSFGIMLMALVILGGVITSTATSNLLFVGGTYIIMYLIGTIPKVGSFMPVKLLSMGLIEADKIAFSTYGKPMVVTALVTVLCILGAVTIFNRKRL